VEGARALARRLPGGARLARAEVRELLRRAPLFAHFDGPALETLASRADLLTLPAGQHVFRQGDASDDMYLLARGAAYVLVEDGQEEKVVDELGSGAVFGELAMLAGERRSASIRTATASLLVRIPRAVLLPLMEHHAHLRQGVWRTFAARRFDDMGRELARYAHLGRKERLAWLQRGEQHTLAANEALCVGADSLLLVLSGLVEFERGGTWMATRGSMLLEADQPLRVVARESAQVLRLPRVGRALPALQAASAP
jgi:hypothetical protein